MTIMSYYFKIKTDKRKGKRIMKNDNSIVKFTAFVLLITMVVLCLVSGTFAKYVDHFEGDDKAVVAKWDVTADVEEGAFDIFDVSKIYDTDGATYSADGGDKDEEVRMGENGNDVIGDGIIAPGTWGVFTIDLTNNSDVSAKYTVDYTAKEEGVFLLWSNDGEHWVDNADDLDVDMDAPGIMKIDEGDQSIDIFWKWSFEADATAIGQSDAEDSALGQAQELAKPSIKVEVDFEQID